MVCFEWRYVLNVDFDKVSYPLLQYTYIGDLAVHIMYLMFKEMYLYLKYK